jgi:nucleotide-binding universal stress UspA family protein
VHGGGRQIERTEATGNGKQGAAAMLKVMVPVDGSEHSTNAVRFLIKRVALYRDPVEIHLINVQYPIASGNVKHFISHEALEKMYQDSGMLALQPARELLEQAGIPGFFHAAVGEPAETIVRYARERACDQIVMSTRGLGTVSGMFLGSVSAKVLHLSKMPVLMVKGDA